jgi:hypothetical protein
MNDVAEVSLVFIMCKMALLEIEGCLLGQLCHVYRAEV